MVFSANNISDWRIGINATTGQITGNYIHDPGFIAGDHTDGIYDQEGTGQLTISGNTVLNNVGQACAIMIESEAGVPVANKTITGNLLAGGDYVIYAGGAQNDSSNIVIQNNRFGQAYYSTSGLYGPDAQFQARRLRQQLDRQRLGQHRGQRHPLTAHLTSPPGGVTGPHQRAGDAVRVHSSARTVVFSLLIVATARGGVRPEGTRVQRLARGRPGRACPGRGRGAGADPASAPGPRLSPATSASGAAAVSWRAQPPHAR